jgi:ribosomal protein S18 acetylase RimI-like enzyme
MTEYGSIVFKKVTTDVEAEMLRRIRNECRLFMTRSIDFITPEQQLEWFKTASEKYDLYLAYQITHGAIIINVGYGLIHKNDDASLLTGGLLPSYRGLGIGQVLFKFLTDNCSKSKPVRLEVLKTNTKAFIVYIKLGFEVIGETDRLYFMEHKYDSPI